MIEIDLDRDRIQSAISASIQKCLYVRRLALMEAIQWHVLSSKTLQLSPVSDSQIHELL